MHAVFERSARVLYPEDVLDLSKYNNNWKNLVRDDNCKNGLYLLYGDKGKWLIEESSFDSVDKFGLKRAFGLWDCGKL